MVKTMELIQQIEAQPLTFDDMKRMLGPFAKHTRLMEYNELQGVGAARDLFSDGINALVILLEIEAPNAPKVGHWIAMLDHGDSYEHFDSYGFTMDEELGLTHEKPYLSNLFNNSGKKLEESRLKLQAQREAVNTCGRWSVARVRLQEFPMMKFVELIRQTNQDPDIGISLLTLFL